RRRARARGLALPAEPVAAFGTRRQRPLAERVCARDEIGRRQAGELGFGQRLDVSFTETQGLRVQRLLEERACKACVAERLITLGTREDRAQRVIGSLAEQGRRPGGAAREHLDQLTER